MAKAKATATKKAMTKSVLIQTIAEMLGENVSRKQVKQTLDMLQEVGHKELKKNKVFVLPGFAKFIVKNVPAKKEREGINPFTKEPMIFAAKPARKDVKARPVKAIKVAVS